MPRPGGELGPQELGPQEHCAVAAGRLSRSAPVSGASATESKHNAGMVSSPGFFPRAGGASARRLLGLSAHGLGITSDTPFQVRARRPKAAELGATKSTCVAPQRCFCWRLLFLPPACCAALFLPPACAAARATELRHRCSCVPGLMLLVRATPCAHPQPRSRRQRPSLTLPTLKRPHSRSRRPRIARSSALLGQRCLTR